MKRLNEIGYQTLCRTSFLFIATIYHLSLGNKLAVRSSSLNETDFKSRGIV